MLPISIGEDEIRAIEKSTGLTHVGEFLAMKGYLNTIPKNTGVKKMNSVRYERTPNPVIDPSVDKSIARGILGREHQDRPANEDDIRGILA